MKHTEFHRAGRSGGASRSGAAVSLPPELVESSVRRLQVVALIFAVLATLSFTVFTFVLRHSALSAIDLVCMPLLVGASIAVFLLSRFRALPATSLLNLGLVYEVLVAFLVGLVMNEGPWPADRMMPSWSPVAVWVVVFPVLVPTAWAKTLPVAVLAAAMDPLSLWLAIELGAPPPDTAIAMARFLPNLPAALMGTLVSSIIYRLGRTLSEARRAGSYVLERKLGEGGMGEVWQARHRMLVRPAAVKLIRQDVLAHHSPAELTDARARFEEEAQAIAALRSPHTVSLYDYGVTNEGQFYYVMELLDGLDFDRLVERFGPLPAERVVYFLEQVCHSLAEAHRKGMVHRDVKPANLFACRLGLECDFVKVLDFGLVKRRETTPKRDVALTADGIIAGTPAYLAPEIAASRGEATPAADVYTVGCVAYWLLCGALVFEAKTPLEVITQHVSEPPMPPSARTELSIPEALEALVMECLSKDPSDRPDDALALRRRLEALQLPRRWRPADAHAWWDTHVPESLGEINAAQSPSASS